MAALGERDGQGVKRARVWPQRFTVVGFCFLAAVIGYLDRVNISVAAISMQDRLGWSAATKGLVLAAFGIGYTLAQIPGGWLASRYGGRAVLGMAVLLWSSVTLLTPAAAAISVPVLLIARVALGLGEGAMFPSAYRLFGQWIPASERSRAVAVLLSGVPIGTLIGLATTGALVGLAGWQSVFFLFGALGLGWVLAWWRFAPASPPEPVAGAATAVGKPPWGLFLASPAVWALVLNHFCSNWGLYLVLAWLPSYLRDTRHLGLEAAGALSALPWIAMVLAVHAGAWLSDLLVGRNVNLTFVRKLMQVSGLVSGAIVLLALPHADSTVAVVSLFCAFMATVGLTTAGYSSNHLDLAPRHAGVLMGLTNTAGQLPGFVCVAVTGWLIDVSGSYNSAFLLAAGVNVVGAVVWVVLASARQIAD
ncbi:MFS transporter [Phenylobacterium sp.]|uniref:MFS transporter n=1 Tax=Phenylobacterium sp. TaxID=1871053 RepID=UPI0035B4EA31